MKFVQAFEVLGYSPANHQTDWSAEKENGVCITFWRVELSVENGLPVYELDLTGQTLPPDHWTTKVGHRKRTAHLQRALNEFDGLVDAILLKGPSGGPYEDAQPWIPEQRNGARWRITRFDPATGGFRAQVDPNAAKTSLE